MLRFSILLFATPSLTMLKPSLTESRNLSSVYGRMVSKGSPSKGARMEQAVFCMLEVGTCGTVIGIWIVSSKYGNW